MHDDVIVVGATGLSHSGLGSGGAHVFEREPDGTWIETARLFPDHGHSLQGFGRSVATDAAVVLIGAEGDISGPAGTLGGAVYAFERDPNDHWRQTDKIVPADADNSDNFGWSLALEGNLLLVGSRRDDGPGPASGSAYVFWRESDGSWTEVAKLKPADLGGRDEFGYSVALKGNLAVIGAPFQNRRLEDGTVLDDVGAAYVFAVGPDLDGDRIMDACICPGDVDGDFFVDVDDLTTVLEYFGETFDPLTFDVAQPDRFLTGATLGSDNPPGVAPARAACQIWPTRCFGALDRDGDVDISDLGLLLAHWERDCP